VALAQFQIVDFKLQIAGGNFSSLHPFQSAIINLKSAIK